MKIAFGKLLMLGAAVAVLFSGASAQAGYQFNVTSVTITPGSGIGDESAAVEGSFPTLLGVDHTLNAAPGVLDIPGGTSSTFTAGTFQFNATETNILNQEKAANAGRINFTVQLQFTDPDGNAQVFDFILQGAGVAGAVSDPAVDYTLMASSQVGNFGTGLSGEYTIDISGLTLASNGDVKNLDVTISVTGAPVPEPTSMALLGCGAIGMLVSGYRRKRA